MSETQGIHVHTPRTAERWTLFFSIATAILLAFMASTIVVAAKIPGQVFNAVSNTEEIGTVVNAQICGNWASFVLDQNKNGLSEAQIDAVWKVTTAKNGSAQDKPISELCGAIPAILEAAGK